MGYAGNQDHWDNILDRAKRLGMQGKTIRQKGIMDAVGLPGDWKKAAVREVFAVYRHAHETYHPQSVEAA